ncbi:MAG TPA: hypothetical protein PKL92_03050 [Aquaticitalea sp.]|nr:hypothetical protein [Aquaticitalea sp.]HNU58755.1 hypothetical protein [Aquaticitalea sp.]
MKLLLITGIKEFENEIKQILKHSGIKSFSLQSVKGYKNNSGNRLGNWFGTHDPGVDSLLFTVFAECGCLDDIYNRVEEFNQKQESLSKVHIATLSTEKSI